MAKFSDDGKSFWDGGEWRPAVSEDGAWRWTGSGWVPNQATPTSGKPSIWARIGWIGAVLAGLVLLLSLVSVADFFGEESQGVRSAPSNLGVALIFASFAVALATPLAYRIARHRGVITAAAIATAIVFLGSCGGGLALVAAYPVPSPSPSSPVVAERSSPVSALKISPTASQVTVASPSPSPSPSPSTSLAPSPSPAAVVPSPKPTPKPAPKASPPPPPPPVDLCGAPANPWGYNFCGRGGLIHNPPSNFCVYFTPCVSTFWTATSGYVVQCASGKWSHSGGVSGACSSNGGVARSLYSGP